MRKTLNKIFAKLGYVQKQPYFFNNIFGHKVFTNPADEAINLHSYNNLPFETVKDRGEIGFLNNTIKENQQVVDLGANIGFFTLLMAKKVGPQGKVFAFEPGPVSFALLNRNIMINQYKNVALHNKAVSAKSGKTDFFLCRTGESDNRLIDTPDEDRDRIEVDTIALDDLLKNDPIDVIKMDIQGAEFFALQGMEGIIKNNPKLKILMEYSPHCLKDAGVDPHKMIDYIESFGFEIHECSNNENPKLIDRNYLMTQVGMGTSKPNINIILSRA